MARAPTPPSAKNTATHGSIHGAVWRIAWPTLFSYVVSGAQGIVDSFVVGNRVGEMGLAALGVGWSIFAVVVVFSSALHTGMGVLVARFTGANETRKVNRVVYQSFLASSFLGIFVFMPLGYVLSPWLLGMVNATAEVQAEALPYLRTLFLCCWGILIFIMLSGALRAAGDAKTPMRLGFIMTALNLVLTIVLVRGFLFIPALGIRGAALGTALAHTLTAVYGLVLLVRGRLPIAFSLSHLGPDWNILGAIFRFGLPSGIQGLLMSLGAAVLIGFIGALEQSAEAQTAYAIAYNNLFSFVNWIGLAMMAAAATGAGQNFGAQRMKRAARTPFSASLVGVLFTLPFVAAFLLIPDRLLLLFSIDDPDVLRLGKELLFYLSFACILLVVGLSYTGALQGTGDTKSPLIVALISRLIVPLGLCFLLKATDNLTSGRVWLALVIGLALRAGLSVFYYRKGSWRQIQVDIGPSLSTHLGVPRPNRSQLQDKPAMLVESPKTQGARVARR
jgi:putative MATE family efflux protein